MWSCVAVLVILMSNLPVYVETKKAEELQAEVLRSDVIWGNIETPNLQPGLHINTKPYTSNAG